MRIAGILLIVVGMLLTGWFGYVELFYLDKLESEFEKQKIKSEETNISRIKETEDKFNKMKAKLKNSKVSEKKIEQLDIQLEDLIMGLKANFNKQEKARNDLLESSIRSVRNENFTVELGIAGIILIIFGGFIIGATFVKTKEDNAIVVEEKEELIEEDINATKLIEEKLLKANLNEANLSDSDLSGTNLTGVNLSNVNFSGANLSGTNLSKVDLTKSNLTKADLTGAKLVEANLTGADLTEANLSEANLSGANLSGANLSKTNLTGVNLRNLYV
ncbi:pentapeptide repeat-containing protein [Deltaproteobacteria bacterium]|nr:pentapeptide repeat-containing protein [Deltaproteobacteria bacterium]